jgi:hypothetical protein
MSVGIRVFSSGCSRSGRRLSPMFGRYSKCTSDLSEVERASFSAMTIASGALAAKQSLSNQSRADAVGAGDQTLVSPRRGKTTCSGQESIVDAHAEGSMKRSAVEDSRPSKLRILCVGTAAASSSCTCGAPTAPPASRGSFRTASLSLLLVGLGRDCEADGGFPSR